MGGSSCGWIELEPRDRQAGEKLSEGKQNLRVAKQQSSKEKTFLNAKTQRSKE
jgi:hypothetical protein